MLRAYLAKIEGNDTLMQTARSATCRIKALVSGLS
jgi:hypothetical protein